MWKRLGFPAKAPASGGGFFVANCFNLFFAIVLLLVLISNENLGGRISVDTGKSRIWVGHRGFRTDFKQKLCIEYGNSDHIKIFTRKETVVDSDGGHSIATTYEIRRYQIGGSHDTIFGFNGFSNTLSKMKAVRIGKSIARVAGLDYRKNSALMDYPES
jgi:preprotein translocase subunit SecG